MIPGIRSGQYYLLEQRSHSRHCKLQSISIACIATRFTFLLGLQILQVFITLAVFVQFGCFRFMVYMSKARYSETGQLLDGGLDLNMEAGVTE